MKEKKKIKERLTSGSLAKKISNAISLLVIICMVIMVVISASLSGTFLTRSINREFEEIASKNGVMVQSIFDSAADTAADLQSYIEAEYDEFSRTGYSEIGRASCRERV